ncbi:GNAT family N-acetyltransferase [Niabella terrae]
MNKFIPITDRLKNGRLVTVRQATSRDASALILTMMRYISQSAHLLSTPNEFFPTKQQMREWIKTMAAEDNSLLLVAVCEDRIVGNLDLKGEQRLKIRHNAVLGIGIEAPWQDLGLGRLLLELALQWAGGNPVLEQLWLHVFESNQRARVLYESLGFRQVACQQDYIKNAAGQYENNLIMNIKTDIKFS